jgi:hypothetical protein
MESHFLSTKWVNPLEATSRKDRYAVTQRKGLNLDPEDFTKE